jgi:hypothetical protein
MYKTISNEIIRQFHPCYDPSKFITDENEELLIKDWAKKYRNVVPIKDIFWLLLREEFLSEKDLRLFAVWCAREALKLIANPDKRSVNACNVAEKFANGEATQEDLLAARVAASVAYVDYAAYAADTNYVTYYASAIVATYYASALAATNYDSALAAAHASALAARDTVSSDAANAAVYDATRASQLEQLLTYFE